MTQMEALELALRLAIAAPDRKRLDEVTSLANQIASRMTPEEVATVQDEILCSFQGGLELPSWKV
mgnify:CR=1 FL=1